mgnify:CR=1 FL=1
MRNNSRKNYRRRRRNTRASQIKLVGIVAVIVVIAIIIVISCFNKTKKDSNKAKDTGTATENVTGVTEQVSETEEAKELFAPKESDATAAIGDELESSYAVVIDEQDGTVVAGKNAHEKMYPASMTKVMTVLVAAEQAEKNAIAAAENENTEIDRQAVIENKLNEVVTITREATDYSYVHDCSTTGFLDGEQVPLRDVFNGTILPSGGESAYQLAVYTAGSMEAFVDMMNAKAKELGMPGITNSVEDVIIARDIVLSKDTGAQLHLCHCSTKDSVEMVRIAKEEGLHVSAEVCPHHFTLTSDDITEYVPQIEAGILIPKETDADTNYKMNPPLRTKEDVEALKEGLRDNIMDVISTDHAPHTFDDKNTSMKKAPFGIVGLETAACLTYSELVLGGYLTPMQMAEKMSYNPAKIVGIDKGDIQPGKKADIVIFDPKETYTIDKNKFASKGRNTPFHGRKVTGRVKCTICDGNVVFNEIKNKTK